MPSATEITSQSRLVWSASLIRRPLSIFVPTNISPPISRLIPGAQRQEFSVVAHGTAKKG